VESTILGEAAADGYSTVAHVYNMQNGGNGYTDDEHYHQSDGWASYVNFGGCAADSDGDGVPNYRDNCPNNYNPGQENFDADGPPWGNGPGIGNGKSIAGNDATVPNGDGWGDACDNDMDNDGIANASDYDQRGDITYDDNNNGTSCLYDLYGPDAADDGPSWDRDCNGIRDGVESSCPLPMNPSGDDDGDGLKNTWEVCKWGTDPGRPDSDGDTLGDCTEAADTNGNGAVDYGVDALNAARAALLPPAAFGKDGDFDINGDRVIDYGVDVLTVARMSLGIQTCQ